MTLTTAHMISSQILQKPIVIPLTNQLSLRMYPDSRPHCMETAALQKGLVLMFDSKERVEEGVGFGVPVVKYLDKTYFSGTAKISKQKTPSGSFIEKTYLMDTISKKTWQGNYIDDAFYSNWHKRFAKIYLSHKELSPLFNRLMEYRQLARIKTEFVKVKPRGIVKIEYLIEGSSVDVNADFSDLSLNGCEEMLVLNEQGSTVFDTYRDANGLTLVGPKIGGWHQVNAKYASMQNNSGQITFKLDKTSEATLFRGWERTKNRFAWAGLSYSLVPFGRTFSYTIKINS